MEGSSKEITSPEPNNGIAAQLAPLDPLLTTAASSLDPSRTPPHSDSADDQPVDDNGMDRKMRRHQDVIASGGINVNHKVLYCSNISNNIDYEELYDEMVEYGTISRLKLKFSTVTNSFDAYITFNNHVDANNAFLAMKDRPGSHKSNCKLLSPANVEDDEYDYIPKKFVKSCHTEMRQTPTLTWHVATYKEGRENFILGSEFIERKIGNIPQGNIKRYGKNILIKAGNKTQAALLANYAPSSKGNIQAVSPHKSFNTAKGVIYSKDLYDLEEHEILSRCPAHVWQVKKLKGKNNTILLTFASNYTPDYIRIQHDRIPVKKFKANPKQCFNCYEYGHVESKCRNSSKCYICSGEHDTTGGCSSDRYCFHCNEAGHSPNSRSCARYKFEQDVLETANNEHISIGGAKRKLMGANRDPGSTYANIVKNLKKSSGKGKNTTNPVALRTKTSEIPVNHNFTTEVNLMDFETPLTSNGNEATPDPVASTSTDLSSKGELSAKAPSTNGSSVEDGFSSQTVRKRNRSFSPKNKNDPIKVSNSFAVLDEDHSVKRLAVAVSTYDENSMTEPKIEHQENIEKQLIPTTEASEANNDASDENIKKSTNEQGTSNNSGPELGQQANGTRIPCSLKKNPVSCQKTKLNRKPGINLPTTRKESGKKSS